MTFLVSYKTFWQAKIGQKSELSHRVICEIIPPFADYKVKCFIIKPLTVGGTVKNIES